MLNNIKFVFVSIAKAHDHILQYLFIVQFDLVAKACLFYFGQEYFRGM